MERMTMKRYWSAIGQWNVLPRERIHGRSFREAYLGFQMKGLFSSRRSCSRVWRGIFFSLPLLRWM